MLARGGHRSGRELLGMIGLLHTTASCPGVHHINGTLVPPAQHATTTARRIQHRRAGGPLVLWWQHGVP